MMKFACLHAPFSMNKTRNKYTNWSGLKLNLAAFFISQAKTIWAVDHIFML